MSSRDQPTWAAEMLKRRHIFTLPFPIPYRSHLEKPSRQSNSGPRVMRPRASEASGVRTAWGAKEEWPGLAKGDRAWHRNDEKELLTNN